jgi:hypothetical protein
LVGAAGIAIRWGGVTVPFGGMHVDGGDNDALDALLTLATQDRWSTPTRPRNALSVRVGRVATALIVGARGPEGSDRVPTHRDDEFSAEAISNLTFVHDQPRSTEGMVVFRQQPLVSPTYEGAERLGETLAEIADLAAERGAPLLFLNAPSSPPPRGKRGIRGDGSRQQWPWASRACLRFAVGMPGSDPLGRLRFQRDLLDFCADRGYGLHLADRRFPRSGGRWFELASGASQESGAATPIENVMPVTVIGPARVASVGAVIAHLRRSKIGIVGATITSLGEIALIHVIVAARPSSSSAEDVADPPADHRAVPTLDWLAGAHGSGSAEATAHDTLLADYLCFVGTTHDAERPEDRRTLWVSWEAPAASGEPLTSFATSLKEAMEEVALFMKTDLAAEHFILRCVSEDLARGRCKLSVPWHPTRDAIGAHEAAGRIAAILERHCRRRLVATQSKLAAAIEVQVSPYESLLGRWHTPTSLA